MTGALGLAVGVLAQQQPRDTGPDFGKASPFGLLIVVLLLIGTALLIWSMNRHLRKLPKSFDHENTEAEQSTGDAGVDDTGDAVDPDSPAKGTKREPG